MFLWDLKRQYSFPSYHVISYKTIEKVKSTKSCEIRYVKSKWGINIHLKILDSELMTLVIIMF